MISVKGMKMPANCETCPFANTNSILFYCRANVDDVKVYSMDNVGKRQADCPLALVDEDNDLISRKKALKTILGQPPEVHYPAWYARQIKELPPAYSNNVLQNLAKEIAVLKQSFKNMNSDYFMGYLDALSLVEVMIAAGVAREVPE